MKNTMLKRLLSFVMVLSMVMSYAVMPVAAETVEDGAEHTHNYVAGEPVAATCTVDGYTTYTCTVEGCGDSYTGDTVTATGHSYENGICTACGDADPSYVAPINEEPAGCEHSWGEGVTTGATCTEAGSTVYTCTVEGCGETKTDTINSLGHSFVDGVCTVCDEVDPDYTAPCNHSWDEGVTTDATCTEAGSMVYTCTVEGCGETKTDAIDAKGHTYENGTCTGCGTAEPVCNCTVRCAETVNMECPVCSTEGGICTYEEEPAPEMPKALYFSDQDKTWGSVVKIVYVDAEGNATEAALSYSERGYFYSGEVPASTVSFYFTDGVSQTQPQTIEAVLKDGYDMCVIFDGETEWMEYAIWEQMVPPTDNNTIDLATAAGSITAAGEYTVTGENATNSLTINPGAGAAVTVTLSNVSVTAASGSAISIESGNVILRVDGINTLTGAQNGSGIYVAEGASVTIQGTGSLTAIGNDGSDTTGGAAGIGNAAGKSGSITIQGGVTVNATGYGKHASGIGGAPSGTITIDGATVNAQGGHYSAGGKLPEGDKYGSSLPEGGAAIGGGYGGGSNDAITIKNNATVTAKGGSKAAGIGAGYWASCTQITIENSTVTAYGGVSSAGIGTSRAGDNGVSANIEIGGTSVVTATGGDHGAGIGGGYNGDSLTNLPITNITIKDSAEVTATGANGGAGIGGGYKTNNLNITISGTAEVTATAGVLNDGSSKTIDQTCACGIGSGANGSSTFVGSTVTIAETATVKVNTQYGGKPAIEGVSEYGSNITVNEAGAPEYVAQIGDTKYETLAAAIAAANEMQDATVILLKNVEGSFPAITVSMTIQGAEGKNIAINCAIAENFNGVNGTVYFQNLTFNNRVSTEHASTDQSQMTLEFKNCTFNTAGTYAIQGGSTGTNPNDVLNSLVIDSCTFNAGETYTANYMVYAQCVNNLTVKNSTFNGNSKFKGAIHTGDSTEQKSTITIEGNTIKNVARGIQVDNRYAESSVSITGNAFVGISATANENKSGAIYLHSNYDETKTSVSITGNTFDTATTTVIYNDQNPSAENTNLSVLGITYTNNKWDGSDTEIKDNEVVKSAPKTYVAQVGETQFETLEEAVAAANGIEGGATVTLLADVELGEQLTISGNVTISGEHTITRADTYTGTLFAVSAGAALTLDGGLVVDGGNNYAFDSAAYKADLENWESSVSAAESAKWFTPEEGAPVATAYMITTSGTVNLNNVSIKNHYSTTGGGIVSASKGANVTLDGAQITHNASTSGSGLVVNASGGVWSREEELITVTMNAGTVIDGNHVGGNHGIFKIYMGTYFTMNGGEIKNTTGWNSNGTAVGIYHAVFTMNGGTICSNSSVVGPNNGRNAAIYGHSNHLFTMNDGTICHNTGRSKAGIDSPYSETGNTGLTVINGGSVENNTILGNWSNADVNGGATLTITGGTFTQDVNQWCANGYKAVDNGDGTWTVTRMYLAEVNGTKYYTVQNAIDAAQSGDTVTLLENVTLTESVVVAADDKITLDLNGKTLQTDASVNDETSVSVINNAGDLTIKDSAGGGAVISNDSYTAEDGAKTKNGFAVSSTGGSKLTIDGAKIVGTNWGYALYVVDAGTTVTIEEGSVIEGRGALYLDGGATGTVNGGRLAITVQTTNAQDNVVYVDSSSELTVEDGTFDATGAGSIFSYGLCSYGTVTVNGGTFSGKQNAYHSKGGDLLARNGGTINVTDGTFQTALVEYDVNSTVSLTGGTYKYDPAAYVAEGYIAEKTDDTTWTVKMDPEKVVAMVGDESFVSIQDAINFAAKGENVTVNVVKDHTVDVNTRTYGYPVLVNGKDITLNMNGKTVTFDYNEKSDAETVWASIRIANGGSLLITGNGTFYNKGTNNASGAGARIVWIASQCSMTIENGTYINDQLDTMFYTSGDNNAEKLATLYIKDGNFKQIGTAGTQNDHDCFNMQDSSASKQLIELSGGTYNEDPRVGRQNSWEVTIAEGYAVKDNGDGTWSVAPAVAKNVETGVGYATLQEALNEAVNGQKVQLLTDLTYDADDILYAHGGGTGFGKYDEYNPSIIYFGGSRVDGVNSPSTVNAVLDLNGHSITNNADAYLFLPMDNAKLTIQDSGNGAGIINTAEKPVIWAVGTDTQVTINSGKYTTANDEGLLWSTHGADLVINGGEFKTTASDASLLIVRNENDRKNPAYFVDGNATVTVNGGSYHGFNPENTPDDSTDPYTYFNSVAAGNCVAESSGVYTVGANAVGKQIPASNATCTKPAMQAHYECAHCGKTFLTAEHKDEADNVTVGTALGHKYDNDGSWMYDEATAAQGHYELCENGCGTKGELVAHTRWSNWTAVKTRAVGQESRYCLDCNYTEHRNVHVHELVFKYNSTYHWQECEATDNLACDHKIVKEKHNMSGWKDGKYGNTSASNWRHQHCLTEGCDYHINRPIVWSYSDNPKTGDYIAIAFGVMAISAAALVTLLVVKKKRR